MQFSIENKQNKTCFQVRFKTTVIFLRKMKNIKNMFNLLMEKETSFFVF